MCHQKSSFIPITYCDTLHASAHMDIHTTYQLLFTVNQYNFSKHNGTSIRLIVELPKIQLKGNYMPFCATTAMAIWPL